MKNQAEVTNKAPLANTVQKPNKVQKLNKAWQKAVTVTSLLIPAIALNAPSASAAIQDFRLHNQTGSSMLSFQVAFPVTNTPWSRNLLSQSLSSGYYTWVNFNENVDQCVFDIRAVFLNGSTYTDRVNLCNITDYTVYR